MPHIIQYDTVDLHRQEHAVLKNVSFTVDPGEYVYLIGKVGSGKSTLLKSIYAEVPINDGSASVFDYDLVNIKRKQIPFLRRQIGYVFQDFQLLFDRTVFANLDFVLKATGWQQRYAREERIDTVLKLVGMQNKTYKMPHELSGGEQQRIVIARAMLNTPKLILADEPTGNLDPETGDQIIQRLNDIAQLGTAVVIATHNLQLLEQYPGRVLKCENRQLIAQN